MLVMAALSLLMRWTYIWLGRSNARCLCATNVVCWLLVALFPVLLLFFLKAPLPARSWVSS